MSKPRRLFAEERIALAYRVLNESQFDPETGALLPAPELQRVLLTAMRVLQIGTTRDRETL